MPELKRGDVVKCTLYMTVADTNTKTLMCVWFDDNQVVHRAHFNASKLQHVELVEKCAEPNDGSDSDRFIVDTNAPQSKISAEMGRRSCDHIEDVRIGRDSYEAFVKSVEKFKADTGKYVMTNTG